MAEETETQMLKTFMQFFYLELQNIKDEDIPIISSPIETGEDLLGYLSDDLKKLSALSTKLGKERDQLGVEIKWTENMDDRKEMIRQGSKLDSKYHFLRELLFMAVREHFNVWDRSIGIRENFAAVAFDSKKGDNPFLKLFGFGDE